MEALIFIAIFVGIIGISFWSKHRQRSNWQTVAHELGLQYVDGGFFGDPSMYGTYRGAKVSVVTEVSGGGKNKSIYTTVEVGLSALAPMDLEVYREGILQKVGKVLGGEDIEVGDADLDKTFIIKGIERDRVRNLLTNPKVKGRLLSAQNRYSTFRIDMGTVGIREGGRTANMDKLRGYIRTVVAAANAIEEACGAKPNRTPQPQPHLSAPAPAARPPAEAGRSSVPFGRPSAADEQTSKPGTSPGEPETAGSGEDDWW